MRSRRQITQFLPLGRRGEPLGSHHYIGVGGGVVGSRRAARSRSRHPIKVREELRNLST